MLKCATSLEVSWLLAIDWTANNICFLSYAFCSSPLAVFVCIPFNHFQCNISSNRILNNRQKYSVPYFSRIYYPVKANSLISFQFSSIQKNPPFSLVLCTFYCFFKWVVRAHSLIPRRLQFPAAVSKIAFFSSTYCSVFSALFLIHSSKCFPQKLFKVEYNESIGAHFNRVQFPRILAIVRAMTHSRRKSSIQIQW